MLSLNWTKGQWSKESEMCEEFITRLIPLGDPLLLFFDASVWGSRDPMESSKYNHWLPSVPGSIPELRKRLCTSQLDSSGSGRPALSVSHLAHDLHGKRENGRSQREEGFGANRSPRKDRGAVLTPGTCERDFMWK